jgi:hypothetical protein
MPSNRTQSVLQRVNDLLAQIEMEKRAAEIGADPSERGDELGQSKHVSTDVEDENLDEFELGEHGKQQEKDLDKTPLHAGAAKVRKNKGDVLGVNPHASGEVDAPDTKDEQEDPGTYEGETTHESKYASMSDESLIKAQVALLNDILADLATGNVEAKTAAYGLDGEGLVEAMDKVASSLAAAIAGYELADEAIQQALQAGILTPDDFDLPEHEKQAIAQLIKSASSNVQDSDQVDQVADVGQPIDEESLQLVKEAADEAGALLQHTIGETIKAAEQDAEIVAKWLHDYGYYLNKAAQEAAADENKEEEKEEKVEKSTEDKGGDVTADTGGDVGVESSGDSDLLQALQEAASEYAPEGGELLAGDEELSLDDIIALSQAMEQAGVSPEELIAQLAAEGEKVSAYVPKELRRRLTKAATHLVKLGKNRKKLHSKAAYNKKVINEVANYIREICGK